eukprot:EG_transcript_5699
MDLDGEKETAAISFPDEDSARGIYTLNCMQRGCRRNTILSRMLPGTTGGWVLLTEIDLNSNLVGKFGMRPVLSVVAKAFNLRRLCLANNGLDDEVVEGLLAALQSCPRLVYLDLSSNPIGRCSAKILLQYVKSNAALQWVLLQETELPESAMLLIDSQVADNRKAAQSAGDAEPFNAATPCARSAAHRAIADHASDLIAELLGDDDAMSDDAAATGDLPPGARTPSEDRDRLGKEQVHSGEGLEHLAILQYRQARETRQDPLSTVELALLMYSALEEAGLPLNPKEVAACLAGVQGPAAAPLGEGDYRAAVRAYLAWVEHHHAEAPAPADALGARGPSDLSPPTSRGDTAVYDPGQPAPASAVAVLCAALAMTSAALGRPAAPAPATPTLTPRPLLKKLPAVKSSAAPPNDDRPVASKQPDVTPATPAQPPAGSAPPSSGSVQPPSPWGWGCGMAVPMPMPPYMPYAMPYPPMVSLPLPPQPYGAFGFGPVGMGLHFPPPMSAPVQFVPPAPSAPVPPPAPVAPHDPPQAPVPRDWRDIAQLYAVPLRSERRARSGPRRAARAPHGYGAEREPRPVGRLSPGQLFDIAHSIVQNLGARAPRLPAEPLPAPPPPAEDDRPRLGAPSPGTVRGPARRPGLKVEEGSLGSHGSRGSQLALSDELLALCRRRGLELKAK